MLKPDPARQPDPHEPRPEVEPGHVPTEEHVPNEQKILPTMRPWVHWLSILGGFFALGAIIVAFPMRLEWAGLALAIVAVLATGTALLMGWNDARVSRLYPSVAGIVALIVFTLVVLDIAEADDALERGTPRLITTDEDLERVDDPADLARTAGERGGPRPAEPAEAPEPADAD